MMGIYTPAFATSRLDALYDSIIEMMMSVK